MTGETKFEKPICPKCGNAITEYATLEFEGKQTLLYVKCACGYKRDYMQESMKLIKKVRR